VPASGSSWLTHLGRDFDRSALGRIGALGPNQQDPELAGPAPRDGSWLRDGFELRGADLFRYTCRACHGAGGKGSPPEILPLVDRVRATSAELQAAQSRAGAGERASTAEALLRHRIATGGPSMPPFDFLSPDESEALLAYLEKMSGVPDPKHADAALRSPVDRVGEQIVKGTCQICHDARAGIPKATSAKGIRALEAMPASASVRDFVARSRHRGAAIHGRGPELLYLRDQELEAAYFYLAAYPPR
jgi:cytochrome c5